MVHQSKIVVASVAGFLANNLSLQATKVNLWESPAQPMTTKCSKIPTETPCQSDQDCYDCSFHDPKYATEGYWCPLNGKCAISNEGKNPYYTVLQAIDSLFGAATLNGINNSPQNYKLALSSGNVKKENSVVAKFTPTWSDYVWDTVDGKVDVEHTRSTLVQPIREAALYNEIHGSLTNPSIPIVRLGSLMTSQRCFGSANLRDGQTTCKKYTTEKQCIANSAENCFWSTTQIINIIETNESTSDKSGEGAESGSGERFTLPPIANTRSVINRPVLGAAGQDCNPKRPKSDNTPDCESLVCTPDKANPDKGTCAPVPLSQ